MATKKTTTKKATTAKKASGAKAATKKAAPKKKTTPKAKAASGNGEAKDKKLSAIDAAAKVLTDTKQAMNAKELVEAMAAKNLWTSPGGKTPHATLYSAILREINTKGNDARFKKTERGKFAANG
jgi:hypothetical protein